MRHIKRTLIAWGIFSLLYWVIMLWIFLPLVGHSDHVLVTPDNPLMERESVLWHNWCYALLHWVSSSMIIGILHTMRFKVSHDSSTILGLVVGACCFAFAGYPLTLFSAGHVGVFATMPFVVLGFWLVIMTLRDGHPLTALLIPMVAVSSLFLNNPDIGALGACGYIGLLLVISLFRRFKVGTSVKLWIPFTLGLCLAVILLQTKWEGLEKTTARRRRQLAQTEMSTYDFCTSWSLEAGELVDVVLPFAHGVENVHPQLKYTGRMGTWNVHLRQHSIYIGLFPLLCVLIAIRSRKSLPIDKVILLYGFLIMGALFLWLALGRWGGVYHIVVRIPFLNMIRGPVKWLSLVNICLAVLAGMGIIVGRLSDRFIVILLLGIHLMTTSYVASRYVKWVDLKDHPKMQVIWRSK